MVVCALRDPQGLFFREKESRIAFGFAESVSEPFFLISRFPL
jgi:hypothetical protein